MLSKQEHSAEIVQDDNGMLSTLWAVPYIPNNGDKLYLHPAPQQKPQKLLLEHSGCGHGTQVEQVTVRLNRGDKVVLLMGPYTAATEAKK
jgi:hypothetical protein